MEDEKKLNCPVISSSFSHSIITRTHRWPYGPWFSFFSTEDTSFFLVTFGEIVGHHHHQVLEELQVVCYVHHHHESWCLTTTPCHYFSLLLPTPFWQPSLSSSAPYNFFRDGEKEIQGYRFSLCFYNVCFYFDDMGIQIHEAKNQPQLLREQNHICC